MTLYGCTRTADGHVEQAFEQKRTDAPNVRVRLLTADGQFIGARRLPADWFYDRPDFRLFLRKGELRDYLKHLAGTLTWTWID
jgi:hypothetical protein